MMRAGLSTSHLSVADDRHAALRDVDECFEAGRMTATVGIPRPARGREFVSGMKNGRTS